MLRSMRLVLCKQALISQWLLCNICIMQRNCQGRNKHQPKCQSSEAAPMAPDPCCTKSEHHQISHPLQNHCWSLLVLRYLSRCRKIWFTVFEGAFTLGFLFIQQQHFFQDTYVIVTVTFPLLPDRRYAVVIHRAVLEGLVILYKQPQSKNPLWHFYRMKLRGAFQKALCCITIVIGSCNF